MIRKLKIKFITPAMTAIFVLLCIIVATMNVVNYITAVHRSQQRLPQKDLYGFCMLFVKRDLGTANFYAKEAINKRK